MKLLIFLFFFSISNVFSQDTYTVGKTEYYVGNYYETGHPKVKRSEVNKKKFLKSKDLKVQPKGYEIDHIIPLSEGGTDDPSNMQLLSIDEHRKKTAKERGNKAKNNIWTHRRQATYSNRNNENNSSTTTRTVPSYSTPYMSPSSISNSRSNSDRVIQTGSRGGQYYINSNGNKTYVKKG